MAIVPTFVNSAKASSFGNSIQVAPIPGSRVNGNLLIALWYFSRDSAATFSFVGDPAGWALGGIANTAGVNFGSACWAWRYVDGTEADVIISASAPTTYRSEGVVLQYDSVSKTNTIGNCSATNGGSAGLVSIPGITTSNFLSTVLCLMVGRGGNTIPTPSNFTSRRSEFFDNPDDNCSDRPYLFTGIATGDISATIAPSDESYAGFLIEVRREFPFNHLVTVQPPPTGLGLVQVRSSRFIG